MSEYRVCQVLGWVFVGFGSAFALDWVPSFWKAALLSVLVMAANVVGYGQGSARPPR